MKHLKLFLLAAIILTASLKSFSQCAVNYSVNGGALQLSWNPGEKPSGIASIDFDGTNYSGSDLGVNNWVTTATSFANGTDDIGSHSIDLNDGMGGVLSAGTCYYNDGDLTMVMPIELVSFSAINNEGTVELYWETATEKENDYFTVERSKDGKNFQTIRVVKGAGNSAYTQSYSSIDESPVNGTAYYRLKQTDYDGTYTYSDLVSVEIKDQEEQLAVFPNPSNGVEIGIEINGFEEDNISLTLYDAVGKQVDSRVITSGSISYRPQQPLQNGIYILVAGGKNKQVTGKLIVNN